MRAFGILGGGVILGSAAILGGVSTLAPYAGTGLLGRTYLFITPKCYVCRSTWAGWWEGSVYGTFLL